MEAEDAFRTYVTWAREHIDRDWSLYWGRKWLRSADPIDSYGRDTHPLHIYKLVQEGKITQKESEVLFNREYAGDEWYSVAADVCIRNKDITIHIVGLLVKAPEGEALDHQLGRFLGWDGTDKMGPGEFAQLVQLENFGCGHMGEHVCGFDMVLSWKRWKRYWKNSFSATIGTLKRREHSMLVNAPRYSCSDLENYIRVFDNDLHETKLGALLGTEQDPLGRICEYALERGISTECLPRRVMCDLVLQYLMKDCNHSSLSDELALGISEQLKEFEAQDCGPGHCYDASNMLIVKLGEHGITSKLESGWFQLDEPDEYNDWRFLYQNDPFKAIHHWVKVNGKILDITYSQFIDEIDDVYPDASSCVFRKTQGDSPYHIVFDRPENLPRYHIASLRDE